jgi:Uma2 family endonuclease
MFLRLSPEFIIGVMSPSDRLKQAQAKVDGWIANGVQLAWLIDGDHETVYVHRKDRTVETRSKLREIVGEGPFNGFVLQLSRFVRA